MGAEEEEGPGVTFPAVGVPDLETGGVDLPLSLGGLVEPGVEAWLLTSLRGLKGPLPLGFTPLLPPPPPTPTLPSFLAAEEGRPGCKE